MRDEEKIIRLKTLEDGSSRRFFPRPRSNLGGALCCDKL